MLDPIADYAYGRTEWRWVAVAVALLAAAAAEATRRRRKRIPPPPPTPAEAGLRLPLFGHLLQMLLFSGGLPHRWFYTLSRRRPGNNTAAARQQHGGGAPDPLLLLWLGRTPALIVSSASAARLILQDHDLAFASRATTSAARAFFYGPVDLVFSPNGPYWRKMKELLMTNLFNVARIQEFAPIRTQEICRLVSSISADSASPQLIRTKVFNMTFDNISRMSLGWPASDFSPDFIKIACDILDVLGAFNLGDFLPAIRWLDLQGYERRIKETRKKIDEILQRIIDDRRKELEASGGKDNNMKKSSDNPKPFLDVLLLEFDGGIHGSKSKDDCIKAILLNLFIGGSDTTSTTIEWALCELLRNKEIMMELREELDNVLGKHLVVQESHIPKLPFLQAVVKETLRLHPPVPLLVPREANKPTEVDGYYVPEKTRIFVNVWAIARDENVWERPFDFRPHRFLNSSVDVKGHHYKLLPFGAGRRACTAMNLGLLIIQQILATLVHCFEWSLPDGKETIDMNEKYGLAVHKAIPLMVKATPRL